MRLTGSGPATSQNPSETSVTYVEWRETTDAVGDTYSAVEVG